MIARILAASGLAAFLMAAPALADDNMTTGSTDYIDPSNPNPGNAQQPPPGQPLETEITSAEERAQGEQPNPGNAQHDENAVVKMQGAGDPDALDEDGGTTTNNRNNQSDAN